MLACVHNVLMLEPLGAGTSMLARRLTALNHSLDKLLKKKPQSR